MTHVPIDGRMWCNEQGEHRWDSTCPHVDNPDAHPRLCCGHFDPMTSQPPRTGSTTTEPRCDWIDYGQPTKCGRPLPCGRHSVDHEGHPFGFTDLIAASPSVTEPETPAAPSPGAWERYNALAAATRNEFPTFEQFCRAEAQAGVGIDAELLAALLDKHEPMYEDSEAGGAYAGCTCGERPESWSLHVARLASLHSDPTGDEG